MDKLPREVLNRILDFLSEAPVATQPTGRDSVSRVAAFAIVSHQWQQAIEAHTFRTLHVKSSDFDQLATILTSASAARLSLIKKVHADILLPEYSKEAYAAFETDDDRAANDRAASEKISALLRILSDTQWPSDGRLALTIDLYSPTDHVPREDNIFAGSIDLRSQRYRYSYISLSDLDYSLPCVGRLTAPQGTTRSLTPDSLVRLTAVFPKLQNFLWSHPEPEYFITHRRQSLQEFAEALSRYRLPPTIKGISIFIEAPEYPHTERLPDLVGSSTPSADGIPGSLCNALRIMLNASSGIEEFSYKGPVEPSLFWDDSDSNGVASDGLSWKSMEDIRIEFELGSFSGQWYFKGSPEDKFYHESSDVPLPYDTAGLAPPGFGSAEDTKASLALIQSMYPLQDEEGFAVDGLDFRRIPRDEAMLPLLSAFARRLATMPSLRRCEMEVRLPHCDWFVFYAGPGLESGYAEYMESPEDVSVGRFFLHFEDWRPSDEVVRLLRDVGRICHGEQSIVTYLPFLW